MEQPSDFLDIARDRITYWVRFVGARRLIAGSAGVVVLVVAGYFMLRPTPTPFEAGVARSGGAVRSPSVDVVASSDSTIVRVLPPAHVTVQVVGAVNKPGVYTLPSSARVDDAVRAAGGATSSADLESINMAQTVADAEQIYVPHKGASIHHPNAPSSRLRPSRPSLTSTTPVTNGTSAGGGNSSVAMPTAASPLDLNAATAAQLDMLPGIGPSTAKAIVTYRTSKGPFGKVDDLLNVKGIGAGRLDAIRSLIRVG